MTSSSITPFNNANIINKRKMLVDYNMKHNEYREHSSYKKYLMRTIKKKCVDEVREYNNTYKQKIYLTYRNYFEELDAMFYGDDPRYNEIVIGCVEYNGLIIPYTEDTSIETIHTILSNDDRFEFAGDKNDLNFQYLFCFLSLVNFVKPRDTNGNEIFKNKSIFYGYSSQKDIEYLLDLTMVIFKRYKHEQIQFDFDRAIIKPITMTAQRQKLTIKSVNECFSKKHKNLTNEQVVDCGLEAKVSHQYHNCPIQ